MSKVSAVVVYEDGQVGLMALPTSLDSFLRTQVLPLSAAIHAEVAQDLPVIRYDRRGQMFDGRPVFCTDDFEIQEAVITRRCIQSDIERMDEKNRWDVRKLMKDTYATVIVLDMWEGDAAAPHEVEELKFNGLASRGARILCAVRKEKL